MSKIKYDAIWQKLRDITTEEYIKQSSSSDNKSAIEANTLSKVLSHMDELENTIEFQILKNDILSKYAK